jgi:hypothetical protein
MCACGVLDRQRDVGVGVSSVKKLCAVQRQKADKKRSKKLVLLARIFVVLK